MRRIGQDTDAQWGRAQAAKYLAELKAAFQHIADRHEGLSKRRPLGVADLRSHRVGSHYVIFLALTPDDLAIVAILHERMDVPARLKALRGSSEIELGNLRAALLRDLYKG